MFPSELTDEQRRKSESNRLKALEKLKERRDKQQSRPTIEEKPPKKIYKKFPQVEIPQKTEPSKIYLSLWSSNSFRADFEYNPLIIETLKSQKIYNYDPGSKRWTFPLKNYFEIFSSLNKIFSADGIPVQVVKNMLDEKNLIKGGPCYEIPAEDWKRPLCDYLMPFQRQSAEAFRARGGRLLIADEMGLGKTLQAIFILAHHIKNVKALIVCPATVKHTWLQHVRQWLPSSSCSLVSSKKDELVGKDIVIINYEMLVRRVLETDKCHFEFVIVDESHNVKNMLSARSKCVLSVTRQAKYVLLLSGTPALSRPAELYPQIHALNPRLFSGFYEFGMRYCNGKKTAWGHDFDGMSNETELRIILNNVIMIRRLKAEILDELPPKERIRVDLDVGIPQSELKSKNYSLAHERGALLEFYNETAKLKLSAVCQYVEDKLKSVHKLVVFAHHRCMLSELRQTLSDYNIVVIDGSTTPENRFTLVEKFQNNYDCRVALVSLMVANCGITLTSASNLIFAELSWTPGMLTQAEDRIHRIGQVKRVVIEYLVALGTADELIWPMIDKKLGVLNKVGFTDGKTRI